MWRIDKNDRKPNRLDDSSNLKPTRRDRPHKNNGFRKIERIARSARSLDECADMLDEFDDSDF